MPKPSDGKIVGYYVHRLSSSKFEVRRMVQCGEFVDDGGLYCTCKTLAEATAERLSIERLLREDIPTC